MEEKRVIRINKVLRELNISLDRAVDYLKEMGHIIESSPNAKINQLEYSILVNQFSRTENPKFIQEIENITGVYLRNKLADSNFQPDDNFYTVNSKNELIELDIFQGNISDLSFIKKYPKLKYLSLINCKISNIDLLKDLSELQILYLQTNNIGDYTAVKSLNNLIELKIADNTIKSFDFLPNKLEILSLQDCYIKDINFLKNAKNLYSLNLSYNIIEDISPLKSLIKINFLKLDNNKILDITPLENFKSFQLLNLSNNFIEDISALKNVKFEGELFISNNRIMDLSPLYKELKRGQFFLNHLDNPTIYPPKSYERLHEIEKWKWFEQGLDLARNKISIAKKNKSKSLNIGSCGLTDLSLLPELFENNEHLEELIISNQYAKYDYNNKIWGSENSEGFYPNNISNIPNEIENLKNLKVLIIGGDWRDKKSKIWNRWRINNINFITKLNKIEILNVSNNMIFELPSLSNHKKIRSIHANNNFINKVGLLKGIDTLEEIYLSNNYLTNVNFLKNLKSLKTLDLHNNQINDLLPLKNNINVIGIEDSKWIVGTINVKDNNIDEVFINILRMSAGQDRKKEIDNYFKRLEQGKYIEVKKLKLILLGNTGAGKTTLADILEGKEKATNGSTHGVNFFNFNVEDIIVRGYDFGGQDYYHNTHYSFFDNRALYAVIWGNNQKDEFNILNGEILFPLNYWLGSLNKYTYSEIIQQFYERLSVIKQQNSFNHLNELNEILKSYSFPILEDNLSSSTIESFILDTNISLNKVKRIIIEIGKKIDDILQNNNTSKYWVNNDILPFSSFVFQNINGNKIWLNELDYKSNFGFIEDFLSFNFHNSGSRLQSIFENITQQKCRVTKLLTIDYDLGLVFENNKDKILLNKDDVKNLKPEINDYDDDEIESLLHSLHTSLSCYYFKIKQPIKEKCENNTLEDIIILDIEKFTDWIYKIFEQKKTNHEDESKNNATRKEVFEKIRATNRKGYFTKDDAITWIDDVFASKYIDYILAFMLQNKMIFKMKNHDCFFAPNYLPDEQTQTEAFFLNSFETPIVKYVFNGHFHSSVMSEIIDKYIDNLILENNKMRYVLWKNKVLLYEDEPNKTKLVYLHLDILCNSNPTISINKFDDTVSDSFILELCNFIEKIIKNYDYNKMIKSKNGTYIPFDKLEETNIGQDNKPTNLFSYENVIYRRSDFKMFLKNDKNYPMKKIFISYSKDDLTLVNQFQDHLAPLKRDGLIASWYCTELIAGGEWDKDIQHHFDESDIICFMVSPNLMRTDYVFNHEIKKAIDRQKKDAEFKIVPIILNFCSWTTNDYNLGNYTALPYTAKPVCDFKDKDMAWYIVTESIKILINSKKQPSGDNWYNVNLPKDVKKIYERIVEGKVDNNS